MRQIYVSEKFKYYFLHKLNTIAHTVIFMLCGLQVVILLIYFGVSRFWNFWNLVSNTSLYWSSTTHFSTIPLSFQFEVDNPILICLQQYLKSQSCYQLTISLFPSISDVSNFIQFSRINDKWYFFNSSAPNFTRKNDQKKRVESRGHERNKQKWTLSKV